MKFTDWIRNFFDTIIHGHQRNTENTYVINEYPNSNAEPPKNVIFRVTVPNAHPSCRGLPAEYLRCMSLSTESSGVICNPGCNFGLWGHLPGDSGIDIQSDIAHAEEAIRKASETHTVYCAFVGKKDAQGKELYSRECWEELVNNNMGVIAKEMGIEPHSLCWCASMHYSENHPHVHILFWDNDNPNTKYISRSQYNAIVERIRIAFYEDIHLLEMTNQPVQLNFPEEYKSVFHDFDLPPAKQPAQSIPKGWVWEEWDDGSGYLKSPDGKSYFSYDRAPYANQGGIEYQKTEQDHYGPFWGSMSEFKGYAESVIRENYLSPEVQQTTDERTSGEKKEIADPVPEPEIDFEM